MLVLSLPSHCHPTRRHSIDPSEWLTQFALVHLEFLTILPSPKPTQICVISKFHQLASESVDIYILPALGSSDQASEFLMRKVLVSGNKHLTAGNFQKRVIILTHSQPLSLFSFFFFSFCLFLSFLPLFFFLAHRIASDFSKGPAQEEEDKRSGQGNGSDKVFGGC